MKRNLQLMCSLNSIVKVSQSQETESQKRRKTYGGTFSMFHVSKWYLER